MAEYNEKIKILMLKGEKGDAYDDTELRAEIEAELANNAYVKVISDGAVELPIHTINDSVTSNASTWSSEKIKEEYPIIKYYIVRTLGATTYTGTCSVTYAELNALLESDKIPYIEVFKNADINYKERYIVSNISRVAGNNYTELKLHAISNDGHIEIIHKNTDVITGTDYNDYDDIKRIKLIEVETTDGTGTAYFTCQTTPHLLGVVRKGTSISTPENILFSLRSDYATSGIVYPTVQLVDDTSNVANRYGLVVNTKETSGTHTVIVSIMY